MSGEAQGKSFIALLAPPEEGGEWPAPTNPRASSSGYATTSTSWAPIGRYFWSWARRLQHNAFEQTLKLVRGSYRRVRAAEQDLLSRRELDEGDSRRRMSGACCSGGEGAAAHLQSGVEAGGDGAAEGDGAAGGDGEDGEDPFGGADGGDEGGAPAEEDENENLLMDEDEDD